MSRRRLVARGGKERASKRQDTSIGGNVQDRITISDFETVNELTSVNVSDARAAVSVGLEVAGRGIGRDKGGQ